jgi:hypothetical protein
MNTETKATSLHDKIYALRHPDPGNDSQDAYNQGIRHAAELAAEYEAGVAQLVAVAGEVVDAYLYRFESATGQVHGPIDDEVFTLRAALLSHKGER